ncbi:hypothetical protein UY3_12719 [Chelonia mydas]|uniref:Uncharacterized protein n=1 Tax=Chelonia mydas TaxID=8469 RepID=M7B3U3_CHEMY|nr:hypothetical protein UY3_12719 [Chelonia mydas]
MGNPPKLNGTALQVNTEAMSSTMTNPVDPAAVEPVLKELGTTSVGKTKWETVTVPSEPFSSCVSETGVAGHAKHLYPQNWRLPQMVVPMELSEWGVSEY